MPAPWHDILTETFKERPELAVDLLRDGLGHDLPRNALVRAESGSLNTRNSQDLHVDTVTVIGPPCGASWRSS
ncbi:hypothetical protein [Actinomadura kijaniata]|uniref:hypothetical protein n=1 Tax=Actinomadura kijaniata TaxID=46161 RepID=UPI00082FA0CA|nr:hypothetical protein [Actinomadura kijaniata]